ncbi:MAG: hypothetical protein WBE26_14945 [Phycisphaerae bacterium]
MVSYIAVTVKRMRQGLLEIVGFYHSHPVMTSWRIPSEGIFEREPIVLYDPSNTMYPAVRSVFC